MFRKIVKEDYNDFLGMGEAFYKSSALEIPLEDEVIVSTFNHIVSNSPYISGYMIEKDGVIAGFATISFAFSTEFGGKLLLFEDLFIKDEFQGLGLGSKTFKFLEDTYKDEVVAIKLEVSQVNKRARKLYLSLGYRINDYVSMIKVM